MYKKVFPYLLITTIYYTMTHYELTISNVNGVKNDKFIYYIY